MLYGRNQHKIVKAIILQFKKEEGELPSWKLLTRSYATFFWVPIALPSMFSSIYHILSKIYLFLHVLVPVMQIS